MSPCYALKHVSAQCWLTVYDTSCIKLLTIYAPLKLADSQCIKHVTHMYKCTVIDDWLFL